MFFSVRGTHHHHRHQKPYEKKQIPTPIPKLQEFGLFNNKKIHPKPGPGPKKKTPGVVVAVL